MIRKMIPFFLAAACILSGCTAKQQAPVPTEPLVLESTMPSVPETTVPETSIPETTIPEVILETGDSITVDGTQLPGGSVIQEDVLFVKAAEFLTALDQCSYDGDDQMGFTAVLRDTAVTIRNGNPVAVNGVVSGAEHSVITYRDSLYLPLVSTCKELEISILDDDGHIYCTGGIMNIQVPEGVDIPVLMYHAVSDDTWGIEELFVSPSDMDEQLAYLMENGYDPITFEDFAHLSDYDKPVILTFDDGYLDNYTELFPLLQKYQAKATVFIVTDVIGVNPHNLTWDQAREMADSGLVSIQSHTKTHPELSSLNYEEQLEEIKGSKHAVTRITGREPFVLCYPSGERDSDTLDIVPQFYQFGIDMNGGLYTTGQNPYTISRYYISRYTSLGEFASIVSNSGT